MPIRRRITDPMGFAGRVSELRESKHLTLAELGRAAGVSGTCVWNWESGNTIPRAESMKGLVSALGTTATYLVEGRDVSSDDRLPPEQPSLSHVIRSAREAISESAGVPISKVRVILDYDE